MFICYIILAKNVYAENYCMPPSEGAWSILTDCTLPEGVYSAPGNVKIGDATHDTVLTIASGADLRMNFCNNNLTIVQGSGVNILPGGMLQHKPFEVSGSGSIKVYLLGGQSNMTGMGNKDDLPLDLQGEQSVYYYEPINYKSDTYCQDCSCFCGDHWGLLRPCAWYHGPELSFGRDLLSQNPGDQIALIKYSKGGSNMAEDWIPPVPGNPGSTGDQYNQFVDTVRDGIAALEAAGFTPEISGMIWMQGESDAYDENYANSYYDNLKNFIANLRSDLNAPDMPFIIGQIANYNTNRAHNDVVRNAQECIVFGGVSCTSPQDPIPYTGLVNPDGLSFIDRAHHDTPGLIGMGECTAVMMDTVSNLSPTDPPPDVIYCGSSPQVIATTPETVDPGNDRPIVPINTEISVEFSLPIDTGTVTNLTFLLEDHLGNPVTAQAYQWMDTYEKRVAFNHDDLEPGRTYTAALTTDIKGRSIFYLESSYTWSFITEAE